MPSDFHHLEYTRPKYSRRDYYALMVSLRNCFSFEESGVAKFRFRVLEHYYRYGWKAACDAFKVKKSSLFNWRKVYENSGKKLASLVPKSTRPKQLRTMVVDPRLLYFIRGMREQYGRVSKYKLKIFLDEYAKSIGASSYGFEKIAKLIRRNHYFFDRPAKKKCQRKPLFPRLKRSPKQMTPGYLEVDSITLYVCSKRYYFVTVIDVVAKFAWCKLVPALSGRSAKEALVEFADHYPHQIREIQTDNGHEFLGEFDQYLEQQKIPHQFSYPRSPKVNGVVERFNRTIQEEFLSRCNDLYTQDWVAFNQSLHRYLAWYNERRPHHSLKMQTPLQYLTQFKT